MASSTFWGIILITCASIAFAFGLYATKMVFRTTINRLTMVICLALLVWSLGLAITVTAENAQISMIGHLLVPIGLGPIHGLLLHFTLLFTGKEKLLKKWWIYPLLYLPGIIMIYGFTILPAMGQYVDGFAHTIYGWVSVINYNIWDYLYYAYYIGFTIINLMVLLVTRKTSTDKNQRILVTLLAICYILAYSFGTLTDVLLGHLNILFPRITSVFSLIPLGVIAYIVRKHGSMNDEFVKQKVFFETDFVSNDVYGIIGFAFGLGGILNIISQKLLYNENAISHINEFSIFLFAVALFILMVNKLKINGITKEMIVAIIFSFVIPYVTLRFVQYGSITIWAFVFVMIIFCVIFSRQILLLTITMSAIMSQFLVWAVSPAVLVEVNMADYIVRLGLIVISVLFSVYVNSVYIAKLKENFIHTDKEAILYEISRNFISATDWNKDEILYNLLEKCGKFIGSERAYIAFFDKELKNSQYFCEWLDKGIQSKIKQFANISPDMLQILLAQLKSGRVMKLTDAMLLPPMAGEFKKLLREQNIRGIINLPVKEKGEIIGIIGFNSSRPLSEWNSDSTDFLEIVANVVSDMLVKIKAEERNQSLAFFDQLTQLPNRIMLNDHLEQAIEQAKRTEEMIGVVFMDIDSFKTINDSLGHALGDKVILEVARVLSGSIRDYDLVARFGGDEFVIILNQLSNANDAVVIMEMLMSEVRKPLNIHGQEFFATISAGIALYPQDGKDSDTLIKNADTALHIAKETGKNKYLMCSSEMKAQMLEDLELTNNIYRALEREQLTLYYQPQINIVTKNIVGFEALLRWSLPGKGMISPATFIPIAEQTRMINPIGKWVLETACRQNRLWQDKGYTGLRMAVNISVHQLNNPRFVQQVEDILKKTGLSPNDLELEITESAVSNNSANMVNILSNLKSLGVTISIDDFGTEYSSLSRLRRLPIDRIKMDIQFVRGIDGDEKDRAITKVIINLAKSMNLKVIAEGVETKIQLDFLSERLCDEVQGFYFYKPMPAEEIEKILMSRNRVQALI